jgi:hypothetical protein
MKTRKENFILSFFKIKTNLNRLDFNYLSLKIGSNILQWICDKVKKINFHTLKSRKVIKNK